MYTPAVFREERREVLDAAIAAYPLATLVTVGAEGLDVSHLPLLHYREDGVLRGHLAKANPQWRNYVAGSEALAIFHGPNHYVSPSWYPSKKEHEKVVPTWNYVVVHARGMLCLKSEPEWLLENVRALTEAQERSAETPWYVTDAPKEFIDGLLGAIIGIEFIVTRWEGKWKVGQNRSTQDREGVIAGLERLASRDAQESDAEKMAKLVKASLGSA